MYCHYYAQEISLEMSRVRVRNIKSRRYDISTLVVDSEVLAPGEIGRLLGVWGILIQGPHNIAPHHHYGVMS